MKLRRLINKIKGLLPTALPNGTTEFEAWAESFFDTYDNMPTEDRNSTKFTLCTIIMHLGQTAAYKPKIYFYLTLKAAAAKQVAGSVFSDIKVKEMARIKAELDKQAEATATPLLAVVP